MPCPRRNTARLCVVVGGAHLTKFNYLFSFLGQLGGKVSAMAQVDPGALTLARWSSHIISALLQAYLNASAMPRFCFLVMAGALERL